MYHPRFSGNHYEMGRKMGEIFKKNNAQFPVKLDSFQIKHGFICQYDKKLHFDTIWSSIFDISNKRIYRAEGNPSKTKFKEDIRLC